MVSLKFDWFDLAYPTENEDEDDVKMCKQTSLYQDIRQRKGKCWYHKNQNSNSKVLHYYYFSVNTFDQSVLSSHETQSNTISPRSRISTSSPQYPLFSKIGDSIFLL